MVSLCQRQRWFFEFLQSSLLGSWGSSFARGLRVWCHSDVPCWQVWWLGHTREACPGRKADSFAESCPNLYIPCIAQVGSGSAWLLVLVRGLYAVFCQAEGEQNEQLSTSLHVGYRSYQYFRVWNQINQLPCLLCKNHRQMNLRWQRFRILVKTELRQMSPRVLITKTTASCGVTFATWQGSISLMDILRTSSPGK